MSIEVYLINFCLGVIIYFILKWRFRRIESKRKRLFISVGGAIILAPLIYVGIVALFYFSIYRGPDPDKANFTETNENIPPLERIDTIKLQMAVDSLLKIQTTGETAPYALTINHSGIEDAYTQYWYFNNDFELECIDNDWAGDGSSGNEIYMFSKSRLLSKAATSKEEGSTTTYTFYHYQLPNSGGIIYENLTEVDSSNNPTTKKTKVEILSKVDFESEEKRILKHITDHLILMGKLKNTSRYADKKIELKQIDTVKLSNYTYNDILIYRVDSLLFKELIRK